MKFFHDSSFYEKILYLGISLIVLASHLGGCSYLNKKIGLHNDNIIEEIIEEGIKNKTGLDIDLSPEGVDPVIFFCKG